MKKFACLHVARLVKCVALVVATSMTSEITPLNTPIPNTRQECGFRIFYVGFYV